MTARILVADGVATTRITLKVRLRAACYEVAIAASGADFVRQYRAARPDLVLMGSAFADLTQIDLCRMVRSSRHVAPVLALASPENRVALLRAGATAVLDPSVDEQMLLARIRGLLRDAESSAVAQLAEAPAEFVRAANSNQADIGASVMLVADAVPRALRWRSLLQQRLDCQFRVSSPEEALASAARGQVADLYVIAADIDARGDGLRLLAELRSRAGSRGAAFIIATAPDRQELSAIALDLGAGDILPLDLGGSANIDIAALAVTAQLGRKRRLDQLRAETLQTLEYAMTDPLTGLHNRRYALPRLAILAREAGEAGQRFAVLVLDLDRFKSINDTCGHAAGDAVLRDIARRIEAVVEGQAMTCRLGGEEFLVAIPHSDAAQACRLAEKLRQEIAAAPVRLPHLSGGGSIPVTVSIGVAVGCPAASAAHPEHMADILLERADRALITAKSLGRNRVMLAQSERAA